MHPSERGSLPPEANPVLIAALDEWRDIVMGLPNPLEIKEDLGAFLDDKGPLAADILFNLSLSPNHYDRFAAVQGLNKIVEANPDRAKILLRNLRDDENEAVRNSAIRLNLKFPRVHTFVSLPRSIWSPECHSH